MLFYLCKYYVRIVLWRSFIPDLEARLLAIARKFMIAEDLQGDYRDRLTIQGFMLSSRFLNTSASYATRYPELKSNEVKTAKTVSKSTKQDRRKLWKNNCELVSGVRQPWPPCQDSGRQVITVFSCARSEGCTWNAQGGIPVQPVVLDCFSVSAGARTY